MTLESNVLYEDKPMYYTMCLGDSWGAGESWNPTKVYESRFKRCKERWLCNHEIMHCWSKTKFILNCQVKLVTILYFLI